MTSATAQPPQSRAAKPQASDRALVDRVVRRDAEAFEELYHRHSGQAFMLARKLCPSRELAEDVVQEAFISMWRSAHRYSPALGSVGVWLGSIVHNRAIDAWRRAAVRPVEVPVLEDGPGQLLSAIGADTPAPERAVVLSLVAELPPPQKEAIFLAYFGDMTHDEIAQRAGAPLGTIKGRIRMGLQKLRLGLEADSRAAGEPALCAEPALARSRAGAGRGARPAAPARIAELDAAAPARVAELDAAAPGRVAELDAAAPGRVSELDSARRRRGALTPRRADAVHAARSRPAA
jgi:RNA polymerase sigma-70 factor (ECF subfamily)